MQGRNKGFQPLKPTKQTIQEIELQRWRNADFDHTLPDYLDHAKSDLPVVTIGGCGRSGSTLLRYMLGSHPNLVDSPETYLFLPKTITKDLPTRLGISEDKLETIFAQHASRALRIEAIIQEYLDNNRKLMWVDKTSRNVHSFQWIGDHFPNSNFIHITRDPLDCVASLKTHPKWAKDGSKQLTGVINPLDDCIDRWLLAQSDADAVREDPRYIAVQYEDLISDPQKELERICKHLGVTFHPAMLEHNVRVSANGNGSQVFTPNNEQASGALNTKRVGSWQESLTLTEAQLVLEKTKDFQHLYRLPSLDLAKLSVDPISR